MSRDCIRHCRATGGRGRTGFSTLFKKCLFVPISTIFFVVKAKLCTFCGIRPKVLPSKIKTSCIFPFFVIGRLPIKLANLLVTSVFTTNVDAVTADIADSSAVVLASCCRQFHGRTKGERQVLILGLSDMKIKITKVLITFTFVDIRDTLST